MPKLYTYMGLIVMFYSNEHEPIHVHAKCQGRELKAEILFEKGILSHIQFKHVRGKKPLTTTEEQNFRELVEAKVIEIREKWIQFFVDNLPIVCEDITRKLK